MNHKRQIEKTFFRTFGGLTIYHKKAPVIISWSSQKARLLLCYLLITSDQWVHHERLVELLWPGYDRDCRDRNFKTTLSNLRTSLSGIKDLNPVLSQGNAYRLNFETITCDCSTFRGEAVAGIRLMNRDDVAQAKEHLKTAQDLYAAEFLPEEPDDPFIGAARSEMDGLNASVMQSLSQIYASEGHSDLFEALREITHFPAFAHSKRRQAQGWRRLRSN